MKVSDKSRDYYIDNLKAVLIILVIIGHFSIKYPWVPVIDRLGDLIYTFHMPCFVFVSGYLAKRVNKDGKLRADKILSFLWLYLLFEVLLSLLKWSFNGEFSFQLFYASQAPWYLLSMAVWYLMVPFIERINIFLMIFGAFAIGILAGYIDIIGQDFSMSRNFVYLPFFVIGFYFTQDNLKKFLNRKILRVIGIVILFGSVLLYLLEHESLKTFLGFIYGGVGYSQIKVITNAGAGGVFRLVWYGVSILLSAAVMQMIPRKRTFFSFLGSRTLQIYILHVLIRNALVFCGFVKWCRNLPGEVNFLLVYGGSVLLAVILGNPLFKKIFDVLEGSWVFRKILR
ncbi:MAG: acyltransferase family protein [Ruminococcus sp.]|jgi:fucose 4-O-acetylase-like acetyltransferase